MFLFVILFLDVVLSKNVYVSSSSGDDSNEGTEDSPLKYCPGMSEYTGSLEIEAGDIVFFKNTDTWSSSETRVLRVTGGVTYNGIDYPSSDGNRAKFIMEEDCSNAVVYFADDHSEIETVFKGFEIDGNKKICQCISINAAGNDLVGATKRVDNVVGHHCGVAYEEYYGDKGYCYGIIATASGGFRLHNVEVINSEVYETGSTNLCCYPTWVGDNPEQNQVSNVLFKNNYLHDHTYGGNGMTIKNDCQNVLIENNVFGYEGNDKKFDTGISITTNGYDLLGPENVVVRNNIIRDTDGAGMAINSNGGDHLGPTDVTIFNNVFWDNQGISIRITSGLDSTQKDQEYFIANNLFYDSNNYYNDAWGRVLEMLSIYFSGSNVADVYLYNNIFQVDESETKRMIAYTAETTKGKFKHERNLFYNSEVSNSDLRNTLVTSNGTNYQLSTIDQFDGTTLYGEPQFEDITSIPSEFISNLPNTNGLSLKNESIGRNVGKVLEGNDIEISINGITRKEGEWDLGPFMFSINEDVGKGNMKTICLFFILIIFIILI